VVNIKIYLREKVMKMYTGFMLDFSDGSDEPLASVTIGNVVIKVNNNKMLK